jgi:carbon storage regulator
MLVLRRKAGEAIVLNGAITIYVLAVEGERVKLGISAPPEVVIVRSELLEGPMGGPGGPMGGPMSGPLDRPPLPPGGSGSSYPRPPRPPGPPERLWREPDRPWREPEPPLRPRPPMPPPPRREPDEEGGGPAGFSGPTHYTPRHRYDTYGPYRSDQQDYDDAPAPAGDDDQDPDRH